MFMAGGPELRLIGLIFVLLQGLVEISQEVALAVSRCSR